MKNEVLIIPSPKLVGIFKRNMCKVLSIIRTQCRVVIIFSSSSMAKSIWLQYRHENVSMVNTYYGQRFIDQTLAHTDHKSETEVQLSFWKVNR